MRSAGRTLHAEQRTSEDGCRYAVYVSDPIRLQQDVDERELWVPPCHAQRGCLLVHLWHGRCERGDGGRWLLVVGRLFVGVSVLDELRIWYTYQTYPTVSCAVCQDRAGGGPLGRGCRTALGGRKVPGVRGTAGGGGGGSGGALA